MVIPNRRLATLRCRCVSRAPRICPAKFLPDNRHLRQHRKLGLCRLPSSCQFALGVGLNARCIVALRRVLGATRDRRRVGVLAAPGVHAVPASSAHSIVGLRPWNRACEGQAAGPRVCAGGRCRLRRNRREARVSAAHRPLILEARHELETSEVRHDSQWPIKLCSSVSQRAATGLGPAGRTVGEERQRWVSAQRDRARGRGSTASVAALVASLPASGELAGPRGPARRRARARRKDG